MTDGFGYGIVARSVGSLVRDRRTRWIDILEVSAVSIVADRVVRTPVAPAGTATTTKSKKHVTPKWVDRVLLAILISIPVLYALGFSINKGPSMGNLGLFYKTSWGTQPTRVGQIVRFAQPDQPTWRKFLLPSIKRVAEIHKDGYFVEGDNTEHSQDSRDWGRVVPPDHVAGVVNWCWSTKRAWRARTAEGRFENWREFNYERKSVLVGMEGFWAVYHERPMLTEIYSGYNKLTSISGQCAGWVNGTLRAQQTRSSGEYQIVGWSQSTGTKVLEDVRLVSTEARTANGWVVQARGPSNQNPLAVLDGGLKTAWGSTIKGSWWRIDLGACRRLTMKCWGGRSGTWPLTDGWEASSNGAGWQAIKLTPSGESTASPNDPRAFAQTEVVARILRFTPDVSQPGGIIELKLE